MRWIGRFFRRSPALATICSIALVLLIVTVSWIAILNHRLGDIPRFDAQLDRPDRPTKVESDALNILLVGVDDGHGNDLKNQLQSGNWVEGSFRSDTMMVWHLSADRQSSQVVSIPRDSWVEIPGRGRAKLNAAFSWGGPRLLVQTIEDTFDLYIDHIAVVDFQGFEDVTRTLGGIEVPQADGTTEHLEGPAALAYVRARKTLPNGDFSRIDRQQNFLRAVLQQTLDRSGMANPFRLSSLVGDLGGLLVLDDNFTDGELRGLATNAARHGVGEVNWMTAPTDGTGTVDGQSIVRIDVPGSRKLFAAIDDDDFAAYREDHRVDVLPAEGAVS